MRSLGFVMSVAATTILFPCAVMAENKTIVGFAKAEARSSTWITVEAPFLGDENDNGYTVFRIGTSPEGPFTATSSLPATGPLGWRGEFISKLTPDTDYYVQVEYFDPVDGLIDSTDGGAIGPGKRLQVLGPIRTMASAPLSVRVDTAIAEARGNEILVSVPIFDDSNANSGATFEVAEHIPNSEDHYLSWSTRCGPSGSVHPKLCRIRSLTPGQSYRIRVQVTDLNGVTGLATQVLPPIRYTGGANVALGKNVAVNPPGWGCCPNPAELTDGRIQYEDFPHGFAWPGGTDCYNGGCPAGNNKTAVIDLGAQTRINRAVMWFHSAQNVPQSWSIETSTNGENYEQVYIATDPRCRAATFPLRTDWSFPACAHTASFPAKDVRYLRYRFNDATLFGGLHGWLVELEVFQSGELTASAASLDFNNQPINTISAEQTVTFTNTGLAPVTLHGLRLTPPGNFSITNRCPTVLNANASCNVGVRYTGSIASPVTATLSVDHDGSGAPTNVQLNGTSTQVVGPVLTLRPSSMQFPAVAVGAQTAEQRLTVTNSGAVATNFQAVSSNPSFLVNNGCGTSLPTGSCTIRVVFAPTVALSFSETLTLSWSGGSQVVSLAGSARPDTDGDGIPDEWEIGLVTVLGEPIDLAAMGARVGVKDIFVEIDYLQDTAHTHQPKPEAIQKVADAYWRQGIALHVDCGPTCIMNPQTGTPWGAASRSDAVPHVDPITGGTTDLGFLVGGLYSWDSFDAIKNLYLGPARSVIFRYGVFAHNLGGVAGTTGHSRTQTQGDRKTASDFIVSLGATANIVGNVLEQAGTFMHELGHNLGLTHGGCTAGTSRVTCDQNAYKPNYLSVMNYVFQTRGLFFNMQDGLIDYSPLPLSSLFENSLDENTGLGPPAANFGTRYWCNDRGGERPVAQANGQIDWDCDGNFASGTDADIDGFGGIQSSAMPGAGDWNLLVFAGGAVGQAGAPPPQPQFTPVEELTQEADRKITTIFGVSVTSGDAVRVPPGGSGTVTFTIENRSSKETDTFRLRFTISPSVTSWVNTTNLPTEVILLPGGKRVITLAVVAPATGGFGEVSLRAESLGNPSLFDVGRVAITSGLADIAVSATDTPDPLLLGNRLNYSAVVQNLGPDSARDVQLTAELPTTLGSVTPTGALCLGTSKVVCTVGNLAPGQSATITIIGTPQTAGILPGVFRTTASTPDPNSANNAAVTSTAVTGRPVIAASVTGQSRSESDLRLQLTFRNTGGEPALGVIITGLVARVLAGSGAVVVSSPTAPVSLGDLAPGATVVLPVTLSVPSTVTRLTLTQSGSVKDAQGSTYSFSLAQGITP